MPVAAKQTQAKRAVRAYSGYGLDARQLMRCRSSVSQYLVHSHYWNEQIRASNDSIYDLLPFDGDAVRYESGRWPASALVHVDFDSSPTLAVVSRFVEHDEPEDEIDGPW